MIKQFRKKPVVIQAVQYFDNVGELVDFVGAYLKIEKCFDKFDSNTLSCYIKTLEGDMLISHGDFVIKGVNGEFYPCKPDIFFKTYDEVEGQ